MRVPFPYTNPSPLVLVEVQGYPNPTCIRSGSGGNFEGYSYATVTQAFFDNQSWPRVENLAATLFYVDFKPEERELSSSERSSIAALTGIPLAKVPAGDRIVNDLSTPATLVGTTLPAGVSLSVFIASSESGGSHIRFSSTSASTLTNFFGGPLASGVTVQAKMKPFIGSGSYTARFLVKTSSPYVALTSLTRP